MKLKVFETIETIWELPDNYFDDKDYEQEDCSDDELASHFKEGKLLYETGNILTATITKLYLGIPVLEFGMGGMLNM